MIPVLGFVAYIRTSTPPLTSTGAAFTAVMAMAMGSMEDSSIARKWRSWMGTTVA